LTYRSSLPTPASPTPAFVICEGVLVVPAWEWDSRQREVCGIPVRINVYPAPDWGASFVLPNGNIVAIRETKWNPDNHDVVNAVVVWASGEEVAWHPIVGPDALLALIRDVAGREAHERPDA
jgi:hypothetical protein